jgi:hypothetical protein
MRLGDDGKDPPQVVGNQDRQYRVRLRFRFNSGKSVTVWERDGRELVDMLTLRETEFEYSRVYRQAGIGRWIAVDRRSNSKAPLDAMDDPRR